MYKLQAFCVLLLTLLAFSQEFTVSSKKTYLLAAQNEVESLKTMDEIVKLEVTFFVPKDVQGNCTMTALDCFSHMLDNLQRKCKHFSDVTNTISHAMMNLEEIMGMDPKERKEKNLCYKGCTLPLQRRTTTQALGDLKNLLQQMCQAQQ